MRPLTDEEVTLLFEKLSKYIGNNIKLLLESPDGETEYVFRLIKNRVYYMSVEVLKQTGVFSKELLLHCGTCFGQFSKSGKFRLSITALDYIAKYATSKVWLKNNGEQNFVYGNHVLKAHIARISENATKYGGVVVLSTSNVPLGFGVLAKSTDDFKGADPSAIYVFNQADVGQFLRIEGDHGKDDD